MKKLLLGILMVLSINNLFGGCGPVGTIYNYPSVGAEQVDVNTKLRFMTEFNDKGLPSHNGWGESITVMEGHIRIYSKEDSALVDSININDFYPKYTEVGIDTFTFDLNKPLDSSTTYFVTIDSYSLTAYQWCVDSRPFIGALASKEIGYPTNWFSSGNSYSWEFTTVSFNDACSETTITIDSTICEGSSVLFDGVERTETGEYIDSLTTIVGNCDSVVKLNLTVNPIYNINDTAIFYVSDPMFEVEVSKTFFVETSILKSNETCDSIVNRYEKYVFESIICTNSIEVFDTILVSVDDTLIINYIVTSMLNEPIGEISVFKLYPNPTIHQIHVDIYNDSYVNGYTIDIYTIGGILKESKTINSSTMTFDLTDYAKGTYMFYIKRSDEIMEAKKIIVK
ncbi:MAG: T9SS type A sorting domain-containing protein [Flavobacteriales bacterium]|nr:T9SS type A sorting domain-containing protein [Flavobacteriales bacterium]